MEDITRALEDSPRDNAKHLDGSPRMVKIARRRSAAVLGESRNRAKRQQMTRRSSFDDPKSTTHRIQWSSFDTSTLRPSEQRVSFEAHKSGVERSSLEVKVLKGLRESFERGAPRLQRSTSALAFEDSDKENRSPTIGM